MPESLELKKAELIELKPDFSGEKDGGKRVSVQFNPDSLKLSFANQISNDGQQGTAGKLHVGAGTTKLSLQLWFDLTRFENPGSAKDVRDLTQQITYFITPQQNAEKKFIPPAVQFHWGSFHFDGIVEAVEETLDYWSNDGLPLRASMSLSMSQQKIQLLESNVPGASKAEQIAGLLTQGGSATAGRSAGTTQLSLASLGATIQGMADASGRGDWQTIAAANGIENPRQLQPGQLLNLNPVTRR